VSRQHLSLLVRNDLSSRFVANAFGGIWVLLLPLLQLGLFAFVFGVIFKARVPGLEGFGYLSFLALGMWPYLAFSEAVARGSAAICDSAGLTSKVAIEPWLLVLARVLVSFGIHGAGFILVLVVLISVGQSLHLLMLPWVLLGWALLLVLAGFAALLAALLQVFIRDVQHILPMLLAALLYASPILYTFEMLPETVRPWFELNPVAGITSLIRDPLLWAKGGEHLLGAASATAIFCLPVWWLYRRLRPHLEDFL
jgi:ABC-type polysaccharide/polyol phosphate export permease